MKAQCANCGVVGVETEKPGMGGLTAGSRTRMDALFCDKCCDETVAQGILVCRKGIPNFEYQIIRSGEQYSIKSSFPAWNEGHGPSNPRFFNSAQDAIDWMLDTAQSEGWIDC